MPTSDVELLRAACCIAAMDGEICERESRVLDKLREQAGVGGASFDQMKKSAMEDPDYYKRQFRYAAGEPERTIALLFKLAMVDGELELEERAMIRHFAEKLGVDDGTYTKLEAKYGA